ncbi:MFS transporter [Rhodococcus sp. MS13]|nr:MFS transporter [Rhodococcus sp. MS13]
MRDDSAMNDENALDEHSPPIVSSIGGNLTIEATIDQMPRVGLSRGGWLALVLAFFFANYDIAVFPLIIPGVKENLGLESADLSWPVMWNLIGYCVGAYFIGRVADRAGRQKGLFLTFLVLGLGGFATGMAWNVESLSLFRFLAGCGMGAVIALCSGYIGEMAPRDRRGEYLSRIYLIGMVLNLVCGLVSLPILNGLHTAGWRLLLMFGGLVLIVLPFINSRSLPESPRWLVAQGRVDEAATIVRQMQRNAGVDPSEGFAETRRADPGESSLRALLRKPLRRRLAIVLGYWFIFYIAMYGVVSYLPLILEGVGIQMSQALEISAYSRVAPIIAAVMVALLIERIERRTLIVAGTLIFAAGVGLIMTGGNTLGAVGALVAAYGVGTMSAPAFMYTAEVFPTAQRGTGTAICDGVGHLGGAVAPFIVLPLLAGPGGYTTCAVVIVLLLVSAGIIRMGDRTKNRDLDAISR